MYQYRAETGSHVCSYTWQHIPWSYHNMFTVTRQLRLCIRSCINKEQRERESRMFIYLKNYKKDPLLNKISAILLFLHTNLYICYLPTDLSNLGIVWLLFIFSSYVIYYSFHRKSPQKFPLLENISWERSYKRISMAPLFCCFIVRSIFSWSFYRSEWVPKCNN
jgi:hypothetical protein